MRCPVVVINNCRKLNSIELSLGLLNVLRKLRTIYWSSCQSWRLRTHDTGFRRPNEETPVTRRSPDIGAIDWSTRFIFKVALTECIYQVPSDRWPSVSHNSVQSKFPTHQHLDNWPPPILDGVSLSCAWHISQNKSRATVVSRVKFACHMHRDLVRACIYYTRVGNMKLSDLIGIIISPEPIEFRLNRYRTRDTKISLFCRYRERNAKSENGNFTVISVGIASLFSSWCAVLLKFPTLGCTGGAHIADTLSVRARNWCKKFNSYEWYRKIYYMSSGKFDIYSFKIIPGDISLLLIYPADKYHRLYITLTI